MSTPLGEEFIRVHADASAFRTELEAQVAAAMRSVEAQVLRAQTQLSRSAAAAAAKAVPAQIVAPTGAQAPAAAAEQPAQVAATEAAAAQARATEQLGAAATVATQKLEALTAAQRATVQAAEAASKAAQTEAVAIREIGAAAVASTRELEALAVAERQVRRVGPAAAAAPRAAVTPPVVQPATPGPAAPVTPGQTQAAEAEAQAVARETAASEQLGAATTATGERLAALSASQKAAMQAAEATTAALTAEVRSVELLGNAAATATPKLEALRLAQERTRRAAAIAPPVAPTLPGAVLLPREVAAPVVQPAPVQTSRAAQTVDQETRARRSLSRIVATTTRNLEALSAAQLVARQGSEAATRLLEQQTQTTLRLGNAATVATQKLEVLAAAQGRVGRVPTVAPVPTARPALVLPPGVAAAPAQRPPPQILTQTQGAQRVATQASEANTQALNTQNTATKNLGNTSRATGAQLNALGTTQRRTAAVTQSMSHDIQQAETAAGRYSRGMIAATAASTGFFRAVTFASGAFLLGAAVGATIGAAVNEFANMTQVAAQTTQLIKATGGAANVTSKQIDELGKSVLRVTGIDDELVKQGADVLLTFRAIRNEAGQGNDVFNRAVKAVGDISAVFRTDLRGSALQLGKALQDPERGVTALRRSGITLTQGQRDLIKVLVQSGATLTAQKLILGEVERQVGGTAAAIGTTLPGKLRIMREEALNSLGELVKRLSQSKTAADLVTGAAQGFSQAWGAVRAAIAAVGPPLVAVARGFAGITQSIGGVGALIAAAAAYKAVTVGAGVAARATGLFAAASAGAARAALIEAQAVAQAAAATLAQAAAAGTATAELEAESAAAARNVITAQRRAGAEANAAKSAQASASAMTALAGVFAISAAASGQWTLAAIAGGIALLGLVAKARAAIIAMRAATGAVTAMGVASATLGGPVGIAAIGVGALALGFLKLRSLGANSAGSLKETAKALDGLNAALETNIRLRAAVGTAREKFGVAQFDVSASQRDLQRAQDRLANTQAAPGSVRFAALQAAVATAQDNATAATKRLTEAQKNLDIALSKNQRNEQEAPTRIRRLTDELERQVRATRATADPAAQARIAQIARNYLNLGDSAAVAQRKAEQLDASRQKGDNAATLSVQAVIDKFTKLADATDGEKGAAREAAAAVLTIASTLNRVPTHRELSIIVTLSQRGVKVDEILRQLGLITSVDVGRFQVGKAITATLEQQNLILTHHLTAERKKLATINEELKKRQEALRTAKLEVQSAQDAVQSAQESRTAAIEGLADAQRGLANSRQALVDAVRESARAVSDARQSLADTIIQSTKAVQDAISSAHEATNTAIQDAKSNLLDLNRSISDSISSFLEKIGQGADRLSPRMRALREQIIQGGGGPETLKAAQQVQFSLQAKEPTINTDKIKRQFDDLTDTFVRGRINLKTYDQRFNTLTKALDVPRFRKLFGSAAANEFLDAVKASRRQAINIAEAPKRTGGAIAQALVNPLRVVHQGMVAISDARKQSARDIHAAMVALSDAIRNQKRDITNAVQGVKDANKAVAKAQTAIVSADRQLAATERRLRQAQHVEITRNTAALTQNAKRTQELKDVLKAKAALFEPKKKPKGGQSQEANALRAGAAP